MPFSRLSVLLASSALVSLSSYADNATAPGEQNPYRMLSTIVVTGSTDAVDEVAGSVSFLTDADLSAPAAARARAASSYSPRMARRCATTACGAAAGESRNGHCNPKGCRG